MVKSFSQFIEEKDPKLAAILSAASQGQAGGMQSQPDPVVPQTGPAPSPGLGLGMSGPAYEQVIAPRRTQSTFRPGYSFSDAPPPPRFDPLGGMPSPVVANSLMDDGPQFYPKTSSDPLGGVPSGIVANSLLGVPNNDVTNMYLKLDAAKRAAEPYRSEGGLVDVSGLGGVVSDAAAWGFNAWDQGRLFTQGRQAKGSYDLAKAIETEIAATGKSFNELFGSGYFDSNGFYQKYGVRAHDGAMLQLTDPRIEDERYRRGLIDAYENGYQSWDMQLTDVGTYVAVKGTFFEPGERAAHEYIQSQKEWWQRAADDTVDDPFNILLPGANVAGKELVMQGGKLVAREAAEAAAKRAAVEAGQAATKETFGSTIASAFRTTAGNVEIGAGRALQAPDYIFNAIPDMVINPIIGGVRESIVAREIPIISNLLDREARSAAHEQRNILQDAANERVGAMRGSTSEMDFGPNIKGPRAPAGPPPTPTPLQALPSGLPPENPNGLWMDVDGILRTRDGIPVDGPSPVTQPFGNVDDVGPQPSLRSAQTPAEVKPTTKTTPGDPLSPLVRIRDVDGGFAVERFNGVRWEQVGDIQPDAGAARDFAESEFGTVKIEGPTTETGLLGTQDQPIVPDNPNVGRANMDQVVKKPTIFDENANPVDSVSPDQSPDIPDKPDISETDPWNVQEATDADSAPPTDVVEDFNPDIAYPKGDPELPDWLGPEGGGIAEYAAAIGSYDPPKGRAFFDEYVPAVREYKQRLDTIDRTKWKDDPNLRAKIDRANQQGWSYEAPSKVMAEMEFMAKSMDTFRRTTGEVYDYQFRYGDELLTEIQDIRDPMGYGFKGLRFEESDTGWLFFDAASDQQIGYVENIGNIIEHAVFSPLDGDASAARAWLKMNPNPRLKQIGDEAARLRFKVRGPGSVSKDTEAALRREATSTSGGAWRTPEKQPYTPSANERTRVSPTTGETQVWVPAEGKGSRPKGMKPGYETDDGIIYMHSGFGGAPPPKSGQAIPKDGGAPEPRTKPFMPMPKPAISTQADTALKKVWERGTYENMSGYQVHDAFIREAQRDKATYKELVAMGANSENVGKDKLRDISKKVRNNEGVAFDPNKSLNKWAGKADLDEQAAALEIKWSHYGDIETDDALDIATQKMGWEYAVSLNPKLLQERKLALDFLHAIIYRLPRTLLLADPVTSWTYVMRNMMGNLTMSGIAEPEVLISPRLWESFKGGWSDPDNSLAGQAVNKLTGGKIPEQYRAAMGVMETITDTGIGEEVLTVGKQKAPGKIRKGAQALGKGPKGRSTPTSRFLENKLNIPHGVNKPFDWMRNVARNSERSMKLATFLPVLQHNVAEVIPEFADYASARGIKMGVNTASSEDIARKMFDLRDANGMFSRDEMYDAMYYHALDNGADAGLAHTYADRVTRDWIDTSKRVLDESAERINYIYPNSMRQTNLDHYMSYVTMFHFWPTRAFTFMMEEMIRDPRLAVAWYRVHRGFERMAEEGEYPDSVKGLISLWSSPLGFALYANPQALFLVTALVPTIPTQDAPQDATALGKILMKIREKTGIAPVPAYDASLGLLGFYGDNFMPDVIPSRTADLVWSGLDYMLVKSGHRPHTPVWDQVMLNAREWLSSIVPFTPTVEAGNAAGHAYDLVGSVVLDQNPELRIRMGAVGPDGRPTPDAGLAWAEYDAIMSNPDDPRYRAAEETVATMGLFTKALNLVFPLSVRAKIVSREETVQLGKEGRAKYGTDEELTPGEQTAVTVRSAVTNSPEALRLEAQKTQDEAFGTEYERSLAKGWADIAYASGDGNFYYITPEMGEIWKGDLAAMSQEERYALADQWLYNVGGKEAYDTFKAKRDEFRATMPEYQQYLDWSSEMRKPSVPETRSMLMAISPGYRAYIDGLSDEVKADPDRFEMASVSTDAYLASLGKSGSVYDTSPGVARDPSAALPGSAGLPWVSSGSEYGSGGKPDTAVTRLEKLNEAIAKYEKEMAAFNAKVQKITGGPAYEDLAPMWQEALMNRLEREGIKVPSKPSIVASYEEWLDLNPGGTIMEYIDWTMSEDVAA